MEIEIEDDEIRLPGWISDTTLTLAEMGAVVCLICIPYSRTDEAQRRMASDEMQEAVKTLKEKGVLKVNVSGTKVNIEVDLDVVDPFPEEEGEES